MVTATAWTPLPDRAGVMMKDTPAVFVWGFDLRHVEIVLVWCAIAGWVEWSDESVAGVGSALWRVHVALFHRLAI